jgi:hypothetical protein
VIRRGVERMKGGPPLMWICVHIHEGQDQYEYINPNTKSFFEMSDKGGELLLAVDLGLRTGVSLYS